MLTARLKTGQLVLAQDSTKNQGPFYCPACKSLLRLRQGEITVAHFAHVSRQECSFCSENESSEHLGLKSALYQALSGQEKVQVEATLPQLGQIADLLVNDCLALEVQCSPLAFERLRQRTQAYHRHGYQVLWLLGKKLWLKHRLTSLQKQFLYYSENYGFYLWELDQDMKVLRLKYLIHEDLHGTVHYLQSVFSLADVTLDHFRRPFAAQPMPQLVFYEDKHIKNYIQACLLRRDKKWLQRQEKAYLLGGNLLQLPLKAFFPQCRPPTCPEGFLQISADLGNYQTNFEHFYKNAGYSYPQRLYPPAYYAIMKAKKAR
ncbi:competence protein CoiA [Streptococcus sp. DD12]|uniref:competence protein CoiA n=1 Tax=Streptococcus sp. DD12 TaxID=1777880 RepID=UPI0007973953|nr:competence protein CoiA family protein [Streptococcus sp. DD12]KXT76894.1 Competence protein CoiA [Streptococcus sp. DD12]